MDYDIDPEKRAELLDNAACGTTQTIGGLTLRPMTAFSFSVWSRLKAAAGDQGGDWALSTFAFAYAHSAPLKKLREGYANPKAMLGDVCDMMASRPASDAALFIPFLAEQLDQLGASDSRELRNDEKDTLDPKT